MMSKWDKLSAEEKNRLVARHVMNWQEKPCESVLAEIEGAWECDVCGLEGDWNHFDKYADHLQLPPRYSENMSDAWEVVQHIRQTWESGFISKQGRFLYDLQWFLGRKANLIWPELLFLLTPDAICRIALEVA